MLCRSRPARVGFGPQPVARSLLAAGLFTAAAALAANKNVRDSQASARNAREAAAAAADAAADSANKIGAAMINAATEACAG